MQKINTQQQKINDQWHVIIANSAKKELAKILRSKHRKKFCEILNTLKHNPYEVSQSFEKLVPPTENYYSRRITSKHRIVYKIFPKDRVIRVTSVWGHYEKSRIKKQQNNPFN